MINFKYIVLKTQKKESNFDLSIIENKFPGKFSASIIEASMNYLKVKRNPFN